MGNRGTQEVSKLFNERSQHRIPGKEARLTGTSVPSRVRGWNLPSCADDYVNFMLISVGVDEAFLGDFLHRFAESGDMR